jgi:hypothetical protein
MNVQSCAVNVNENQVRRCRGFYELRVCGTYRTNGAGLLSLPMPEVGV